MTKAKQPELTMAALRIVPAPKPDPVEDEDEKLVLEMRQAAAERAEQPAQNPTAKVRGKGGLFAQVPLHWLSERHWDDMFPPPTRLYLHLQNESRRGTRDVLLTNTLAATVGISRRHKTEYLKKLEERGLVTVRRSGNSAPRVSVATLSRGQGHSVP